MVIWGADEDGEAQETAVEAASEPVEAPKPSLDPDELKVVLETYLSNTLPDLVRRSLGGLVDEAISIALGEGKVEAGEPSAEESAASDAQAQPSQPNKPADQLDSMLFLSALASSQVDSSSTLNQPLNSSANPNGVHLHEPTAESPAADAVEGEDVDSGTDAITDATTDSVGAEDRPVKRRRSSKREADGNNPSGGGPRTQA